MADQFEQLTSEAQMTSAQPGDIEQALKQAGLFELSDKVAPLLNTAKVPDTSSVQINMVVDKGMNVGFLVTLNPPSNAGNALAGLLKRQFSGAMKQALIKAKLNVADTVSLKWLTF